MCESGAVVILNLSASNELIGKAEYRESLVSSQSARGVCAYIYSSSGVGESSTDTIFGGDLIIAEYGSTLSRAERFTLNSQLISADVDLFRLKALRIREGTFADSIPKNFRRVPLKPLPRIERVERYIDPHPFVPKDRENLNRRAEEIIKIQAHSLIKRVLSADIQKAMIGVSGGLDSTLALLVTHFAFKTIKRSSKDIVAVLMPSFGTTDRTFNNALNLCKALDVSYKTISIKELVLKEFELIGHNPDSYDTTYENVQARVRTSILMNIANREGGLVVGTGDLSEIALGWSTYNGDQMSMYGINSSIPKTLIKYLIEYFALSDGSGRLREVLEDILDTPISPELLPPNGKEISQKTEEIIGPYELHDFFLYHFIRYGTSPDRLFYLSTIAFGDRYDKNTVKKWLKLFIKRFFTQQFKRSSMPDGVKVGTISLSPRADWRMPSDASFKEWLRIVDDL
jgi:NAD+ synthase (glutamine-hydrolysing)